MNDTAPSGEHKPKPSTDGFVPPEKVADAEDAADEATGETAATSEASKAKLPHWLQFSKKQWLIIGSVAVVVLAGSVTAYALFHTAPPKKPTVHTAVVRPKKAAPAPTTVPSTLTGL